MLTAVTAFALTGCGSVYESHNNSYMQIDDVPGVTFDMPRGLSENATAITEISNDENYDSSTYVYKDGKTKYILFNIRSVVIIASNDTSFDFGRGDMEKTLKNSDLDGIWFKADEGGLKGQRETRAESSKVMCNVNADVSITTSLYGTFSGVFANVKHGKYECSIFAGMAADKYKDITSSNRKVLEHIVRTLDYDPDTADLKGIASGDASKRNDSLPENTQQNEKAGSDAKVEASIEKVNDKGKQDVQASIEKVGSDDGDGDDKEDSSSIVSDLNNGNENSGDQDRFGIQSKKDKKKNDGKDKEKSSSSKAGSKSSKKNLYSGEEDEGISSDFNKGAETLLIKTKNTASGLSNDDIVKEEKKRRASETKDSDIYNMLKIGDTGKYKHLDDYGKEVKDTVRLDTVYTDNYAAKLMKVLVPDSEYREPPAGESWHIARFYVSCDPTKLYTDVRVRGLDGGKLNYRGISYSSRTYDILDNVIRYGSGYSDLYVYYLIPNGCKSYMLEFGDRDSTKKDGYGTACYLVTGYRK